MSLARLGETIENPSVTQLMATYPTKELFDEAAQQGKIKPTTEAGVVSNIYNRIVNAALAQKAKTETTVFQDNTQSAPQMGLAAAQQMQGQPAGAGLDQIPVPEQMFNAPQGMAGGGIVAFQSAGFVADRRLLAMMNGQERAEYQMTGKIPARLQNLMQPTASDASDASDARFARQGTGVPMSSAGLAAQGFTPPAAPPRAASNLPSTSQMAAQQAAVQQGTTPLGLEEEFNQDFAMIQRVLGEDPTRARLKALYEKQEKEAEANARTDNAMRLIEAGLLVGGGTSPYAGANFALAAPAVRGAGEDVRARRKEATERAKGMAELEGMTRKEKADILTQTMARRREDKKTKEDREFKENLVRLQAKLRPEDFDARAARILENGTPEQKAAVRKVYGLKGRGASGQLTENQIANLRAKAVKSAADKALLDQRYQRAKTPQERASILKIIEREEFEKLVPDSNKSGEDPLNLFG